MRQCAGGGVRVVSAACARASLSELGLTHRPPEPSTAGYGVFDWAERRERYSGEWKDGVAHGQARMPTPSE